MPVAAVRLRRCLPRREWRIWFASATNNHGSRAGASLCGNEARRRWSVAAVQAPHRYSSRLSPTQAPPGLVGPVRSAESAILRGWRPSVVGFARSFRAVLSGHVPSWVSSVRSLQQGSAVPRTFTGKVNQSPRGLVAPAAGARCRRSLRSSAGGLRPSKSWRLAASWRGLPCCAFAWSGVRGPSKARLALKLRSLRSCPVWSRIGDGHCSGVSSSWERPPDAAQPKRSSARCRVVILQAGIFDPRPGNSLTRDPVPALKQPSSGHLVSLTS